MNLKKISTAIPLKRLVTYLMFLGLIPLGLITYDYCHERQELLALSQHIEEVRHKGALKKQKQSINLSVRQMFANIDNFYIDHVLEKLSFLNKEKAALESMIHSPSYTGNEAAESRLAFINGNNNSLSFVEGTVQKGDGLLETVEALSHPVEMDAEDLKNLLFHIEEKKDNKPQLVITDFKLVKKKTLPQSEVFEVSLKLLKREFVTP